MFNQLQPVVELVHKHKEDEPLRVERIIWIPEIVDKLAAKHGVLVTEVEEVFHAQPLIRRMRRGHRPGEDVYAALGQTIAGRYLIVFFVYKK